MAPYHRPPDLPDPDDPIVGSLTDDDFYKFTMLYVIWSDLRLRHADTLFAFTNRTTAVPLALHVRQDDIERELGRVAGMTFNETELRYLGGQYMTETVGGTSASRRMFPQEFIDDLRTLRLTPPTVQRQPDDTYTVEVRGPWWQASLWEMHILQIMSELYFRSRIKGLSRFGRACVVPEGQVRLREKLKIIRNHPGLTYSEFGTRRRAFRAWQEYVARICADETPLNFVGTSNVRLSMELGTEPRGTCAHEMTMGMSGVMGDTDEGIRASQAATLDRWWAAYGAPLSVALSDTYGSEAFLEDFASRAALWKGTRQDSGDPFAFGDRMVAFYRQLGIDPKTKLIVFSDGLHAFRMLELFLRFRDVIGVTFGWGTNLVNDLGDLLQPLSLIVKLRKINGRPTVKLSDNIAKALGPDDEVERFKRIFRYGTTYNVQPEY